MPHCVGHSLSHALKASPVKNIHGPLPEEIYFEAQKLDYWPGENYDGTSVDGGARFLYHQGYFTNYTWASDIEELKAFILYKGPAIVGTNYYTGMFDPDSRGFVDLSGSNEGGHAYLCIGYSSKKRAFRFLNSWGREWGQKARFWIREDDFQRLIEENGEICCPVEFKVQPLGGL